MTDLGSPGKSLAEKLGIAPGTILLALHAPAGYETWLAPLPKGAEVVRQLAGPLHTVHLFATERAALAHELLVVRERLAPDGTLWVSWPKRAAKVATDLTENVVRDLALPLGLVDIKVCSVTDVWSGLKLVIRKPLRAPIELPPRPRA